MRFLGDKSALARLAGPRVTPVLRPLIARGLVVMCAVVQLEVGHSARSADELERLLADHAASYPWVEVPEHAWRRAQLVQVALARRGQHPGDRAKAFSRCLRTVASETESRRAIWRLLSPAATYCRISFCRDVLQDLVLP